MRLLSLTIIFDFLFCDQPTDWTAAYSNIIIAVGPQVSLRHHQGSIAYNGAVYMKWNLSQIKDVYNSI